MAKNIIYHHEDWQKTPLWNFLVPHWAQWQGGPLPAFGEIQGNVEALINQGRWLVNCPNACGNAIVVSAVAPYYICVECGSPENDGKWYTVVFPRQKAVIESVLLERPEKIPFQAKTRNWAPGESLYKLRKENKDRGII